jgi:hypothetical protein
MGAYLNEDYQKRFGELLAETSSKATARAALFS